MILHCKGLIRTQHFSSCYLRTSKYRKEKTPCRRQGQTHSLSSSDYRSSLQGSDYTNIYFPRDKWRFDSVLFPNLTSKYENQNGGECCLQILFIYLAFLKDKNLDLLRSRFISFINYRGTWIPLACTE